MLITVLDIINSCKTIKQMVAICDEQFDKFAEGSARIVYKIDDNTVLKIPKNKKGLAQNIVEFRLFNNNRLSEYEHNILNPIIQYGNRGRYIVSPFLIPVNFVEFENYFGVKIRIIKRLCKAINRVARGKENKWSEEEVLNVYNKEYPEDIVTSLPEKTKQFINACEDLSLNFGIALGDFGRISTYGKNKNGEIKIVDYGSSYAVIDKFYKKK